MSKTNRIRITSRLATAVALIALGFSPAIAQTVWVTGDIQGAYLTSGDEDFRPGLARLANQWDRGRGKRDLLIDGGNLFFGHHLIGEDPAKLLTAPSAFDYDVVHISYLDLAYGPDVLLEHLPNQTYAAVSANLVTNEGQAIAQPYALLEAGRQRIAVTGVSGLSESWLAKPQMERFAAMASVLDPAASVMEILPEMRAEADRVIVLFAGEIRELQKLMNQLGDQVDAFIVGASPGGMNDPLPEGALNGRGTFGNRALRWNARSGRSDFGHADNMQEEARLPLEALAQLGIAREPSFSELLPAEQLPEGGLPLNQTVAVRLSGANRAMRLSVRGITRTNEWQRRTAPDGYQFLVVDTIAENRKPRDLIAQDNGQEAILFGSLEEVLVLVFGEDRLIPLHSEQENFDNAFPLSFVLPAPRTRLRRDFVFLVPEGEPERLELRHHHIEYAPIAISLIGNERDAEIPTLSRNAQRNDFLALEAKDIRTHSAAESTQGTNDSQTVDVHLIGKSQLVRMNPANHFQRGADPQEEIETHRVMRFLRAEDHLQIVTPEGYVYLADWESSELPPTPLLLPDRATGGRLIFRLPANVTEFEFVAYFPNFGTVTEGTAGFMEEMRFPMGDQPMQYQDYPVLIDFELDQLAMVASHIETVNEWPGVSPRNGQKIVLADFVIVNETSDPGFWDMSARIGLTLEGNRRITPAALTDANGWPLANPIHLPPGEPRRIRHAFVVPASSVSGQVDVRGVADNPYREMSWD